MLPASYIQREADIAAIVRSAQAVYIGLTTRAAHQALIDAFRGGSAGVAFTPTAPWRAYLTTVPGLKP